MSKRYVCVSTACRREAEIEIPLSDVDGQTSNPKCSYCGSEMKKVYTKPAFVKLSEAEAIQRFGDLLSTKSFHAKAGR